MPRFSINYSGTNNNILHNSTLLSVSSRLQIRQKGHIRGHYLINIIHVVHIFSLHFFIKKYIVIKTSPIITSIAEN